MKTSPFFPFTLKEREKIFSFLKDHLSEPFQIFPIKRDGSLRAYFRVTCKDQTQVLLYWKDISKTQALFFPLIYECFLQQKVRVPLIEGFSTDKVLFLIEDLTDLSLEKKAKSLKENKNSLHSFYKDAIGELVKIHSSFLEKDQGRNSFLNKKYQDVFKESLNQERLMKEVDFTVFHLLETFLKKKLSQVERQVIQNTFSNICEKLEREEKRISHRDYHSRNLMIKEGKIRVIDFQDARLAPLYYDLASLLFDPYTPIEEVLREELMDTYMDIAGFPASKGLSKEGFKRCLFLQSLQRNFKACGSFASFYNLRQDSSYVKYISVSFCTMKENLKGLNEYKDFYSFIQDHGLERIS